MAILVGFLTKKITRQVFFQNLSMCDGDDEIDAEMMGQFEDMKDKIKMMYEKYEEMNERSYSEDDDDRRAVKVCVGDA